MNRLWIALEGLLQKQMGEEEDVTLIWERISREIKGSIFILLTLFELVSLVSYIPIDSLNIFEGRLDHLNNLGGIVGAMAAEWFLGTVGVGGYAIIFLTAWVAYRSFRGIPLKNNLFKFVGAAFGTLLFAVTCYLLVSERFPEASLLQGGIVGRTAGLFLRKYFNTTGALLLVGGGFLVTSILLFGVSVSRGMSSLLKQTEEEELNEPQMRAAPRMTSAPRTIATAPKKAKKKKKPAAQVAVPNGNSADANDDGDSIDEDPTLVLEDPDQTDVLEVPGGFQDIIPFTGSYAAPSTRLLKNESNSGKKTSRGDLNANAKKLMDHLASFQITGEMVAISQGPVVNTYEYKPAAGIKLKSIANLQEDLGVVLGTRELRVMAPIPGKTVVGIEVPKSSPETISLKEIISHDGFWDKKLKLPIALGKGTDGTPIFGDLAAMPHVLVAGSTGSGKSVFINCLIMSLLYRMTPQNLRMILIDPKMLEMSVFDGLPHLLTNVITDNKKAFHALNWAVEEMERRYQLMSENGSKNIDSFNQKISVAADKMPYIVIVIDELADLMMSGGDIVEVAITRLAQKARAAGIHMVIATQRPSTDVITGLIKANVPSRIAFKVPSSIDSRTILDTSGAEELIGRGDSLVTTPSMTLKRVHGCFVTEDELNRVVKFIKTRDFSKYYIPFSSMGPDEE